jgi:hypothetical protein
MGSVLAGFLVQILSKVLLPDLTSVLSLTVRLYIFALIVLAIGFAIYYLLILGGCAAAVGSPERESYERLEARLLAGGTPERPQSDDRLFLVPPRPAVRSPLATPFRGSDRMYIEHNINILNPAAGASNLRLNRSKSFESPIDLTHSILWSRIPTSMGRKCLVDCGKLLRISVVKIQIETHAP